MPEVHSSRRLILVHLSLLLTVAMWGGTYVAQKFLLSEVRPTTIVLLRYWLASILFILFIPVFRPKFREVRRLDVLLFAVAGVMGIVVPGVAITYGQQFVTAGMSSLVVVTNPIFTAVFSSLLMSEAIGLRKVLGIIAAGAGIVVVVGWGLPGTQVAASHVLGVVVMLAGPCAFAGFTLLGKSLMGRYSPVDLTMYVMLFGSVILAPLGFSLAGQLSNISAGGWWVVIYLGVFSTFLAFILWYNGVKYLAPTQAAIYGNFTPVFATLGGSLLLGERLTLFLLLGGALVLAGIVLVNTDQPRPRRRGKAVRAGVPAADQESSLARDEARQRSS